MPICARINLVYVPYKLNKIKKGKKMKKSIGWVLSLSLMLSSLLGAASILKTKGPNGNNAVSYKEINISNDQKDQIRKKNLKAVLLLHTSSDFTNSIKLGVQESFKNLGIDLVLTTDAGFDSNKQRMDIETAMVLNPDIIITLILDPVSGAVALRPAIEKGIKIVLISNLPKDFKHLKDYASIVTDDLFGMGEAVAQMMNTQLKGKGNVALMYHDANYYVTNQRDQAVKSVLIKEYPGINIITSKGIANPSDAEAIAGAIITQNPNVNAIYAPWDSIAEGVVAAARSANRRDIKIYTMDLGEINALDMAKGRNISGIIADLPYELGETVAKVGALNVLNIKTPPFITVPAIKISKDNLEEAWKESLKRDLPKSVKRALSR